MACFIGIDIGSTATKLAVLDEPRENIANGVVSSVVKRVATLVQQVGGGAYFLTGGLCDNDYVVARLGAELGAPLTSCPEARYAGALGAALAAKEL